MKFSLVQVRKTELKLIRERVAKWPGYVAGVFSRRSRHAAALLRREGLML